MVKQRAAGRKDRQGSAAIEFALVGPIFIILLSGMVVYGGWFWLAQSVQSLATESARAAVAGMDDAERRQLAMTFVTQQSTQESGLDPALIVTTVTSDANAVHVTIAYDAHAHPILLLAGPLPKPPNVIKRTAIIRIGGY